MITNNEPENIWKEAVEVRICLNILPQYLPGGSKRHAAPL
jgi:hypothetical protein